VKISCSTSVAALLDRHQCAHVPLRAGQEGVAQRHAVLGGADDLDQLVLGDRVAGLAAEDVVEAGLRTALVAQPQEVLQRIGDPPAREEVDRDVELVLGRHVRRAAVPLQHPLVDRIDVLDEGQLELQAGGRDRLADGLAELGDDHLLDLAHGIERADATRFRCPRRAKMAGASRFMAAPPFRG
jgi:hypothetical protein